MEQELLSQRVTKDEVLSALRSSGAEDLADVDAVVLETDCSMSVLKGRSEPAPSPTLASVTSAVSEADMTVESPGIGHAPALREDGPHLGGSLGRRPPVASR